MRRCKCYVPYFLVTSTKARARDFYSVQIVIFYLISEVHKVNSNQNILRSRCNFVSLYACSKVVLFKCLVFLNKIKDNNISILKQKNILPFEILIKILKMNSISRCIFYISCFLD